MTAPSYFDYAEAGTGGIAMSHDEPSNEELGITPIWTLAELIAALCLAGVAAVVGFCVGRYFF